MFDGCCQLRHADYTQNHSAKQGNSGSLLIACCAGCCQVLISVKTMFECPGTYLVPADADSLSRAPFKRAAHMQAAKRRAC